MQNREAKEDDFAPRARYDLATVRLAAEVFNNLSAESGVAYMSLGAILTSLVVFNPPPMRYLQTTRDIHDPVAPGLFGL